MIFPFLFQPSYMQDIQVPQGKRILIDGGSLDNTPIFATDISSNTGCTLGFNRKSVAFTLMPDNTPENRYCDINNIVKYTLTFINCLHEKLHVVQSQQPYYWQRVVPVNTCGVKTLDFDIKKEKIIQCINAGRETAAIFLDRRERLIKSEGPLPRNLFIPNDYLRLQGHNYLPNSLIEHTAIYQTNSSNT